MDSPTLITLGSVVIGAAALVMSAIGQKTKANETYVARLERELAEAKADIEKLRKDVDECQRECALCERRLQQRDQQIFELLQERDARNRERGN